ncbi:MAG TPA: DinB family protein, partial [Saprospiraceae bacterium]|nr:DinB family protein [Saprospiraceae bacterium]
MLRSQIHPLPEYFDRYILMADDVDVIESIQISLDEIDRFPLEKWKALGDTVYAPGKWTVRDILQHLIDTERIFSYRALAAARGEKQTMPYFEEDEYAIAASANNRTLEDLIEEMRISRRSFLALYQSFTPDMLQRMCKGFKGEYSVLSIGFVITGHQRWHLRILEERYYSLVVSVEG